MTAPLVPGVILEYLSWQTTSSSDWGAPFLMPGKLLVQSAAKYRMIFQVLPQSKDFSMYMAAGLKVLKVMMMWVTWNSASRSSWIETFSFPVLA